LREIEISYKNMAIFEAITQIIASKEYNDDSCKFFERNFGIFDD